MDSTAGFLLLMQFLDDTPGLPDPHCAPPAYQRIWGGVGSSSPGVCIKGYTVGPCCEACMLIWWT